MYLYKALQFQDDFFSSIQATTRALASPLMTSLLLNWRLPRLVPTSALHQSQAMAITLVAMESSVDGDVLVVSNGDSVPICSS